MIEAAVQFFEEKRNKNGGLAERALAETIQYFVLLGISRSDFFKYAAFYGGTALRMLYGLDRFSEDLDFSLENPPASFRFEPYLKAVRDELLSYGFEVEVAGRDKRIETPVESAFVKANTKIHILQTRVPEVVARRIPGNAVCKVKLEIDTDPPDGAGLEARYIDDPVPFSLRVYDGPSLFAGKVSAVLSRGWKNRIKGRDWFDFVYFVRKEIPLALAHLESRLRQGGYYSGEDPLDEDMARNLLHQRIEEVNLESAKEDTIRFIRNTADVDIWSKDYFFHVLEKMKFSR